MPASSTAASTQDNDLKNASTQVSQLGASLAISQRLFVAAAGGSTAFIANTADLMQG